MGEKQKWIGKSFSYEGIFNYKSLFSEMDSWLREHWYDKCESRSEEFVLPDGTKQIGIEFRPWKKYTDYYKGVIKIESMVIMKPVEIEMGGKTVKMHQGKAEFRFTGYLFVDYRWFYGSRWDKTPLLYFIRDIFDKYVNFRYTMKYRRMIVNDTNELANVMMSNLNMSSYKLKMP